MILNQRKNQCIYSNLELEKWYLITKSTLIYIINSLNNTINVNNNNNNNINNDNMMINNNNNNSNNNKNNNS